MGIFDQVINGIGDALGGAVDAGFKAVDNLRGKNPGSHGSHNPEHRDIFTGGGAFVSATFTPELAAAQGPTYGQLGNRPGAPPEVDESSFTPELIASRAKPIFKGSSP